MTSTASRNTFLAQTLLRAICPPPPWAEIIAISYYDPAGHVSPPNFLPAHGGGHNLDLTILDVTTTPVTTHHITLDDAYNAITIIIEGTIDNITSKTVAQLTAGMNGTLDATQLDDTIPTLILHLATFGPNTELPRISTDPTTHDNTHTERIMMDHPAFLNTAEPF